MFKLIIKKSVNNSITTTTFKFNTFSELSKYMQFYFFRLNHNERLEAYNDNDRLIYSFSGKSFIE